MGVAIFFSRILSYFCFFVAAFRPCQGRLNAENKQSVRSNLVGPNYLIEKRTVKAIDLPKALDKN